MVDINKYLEDQLSKKLASDNKKAKDKKSEELPTTSKTTRQSQFNFHESSDEGDDTDKLDPFKLIKRNNPKIAKPKDDGDVKSYNSRIKASKAIIKKNINTENEVNNIETDNKEEEEFHELDGGLKVPKIIWKKLYRYQKTGVKWLWELHQIESGGLLGDEMGLGKTVQIIAFLAALDVTRKGIWNGLGPSLIVAPATVIHQWVMHFHLWWPPLRVAVLHQSGSYVGTPDKLIRDIQKSHGVLITTYAGIVKHISCLDIFKWHYIILDEGHKIRNSDTQISRVVRKIDTPHRIVITGSPLQNNLQELWSLFDFMSPGLLGALPAFMEHFAIPITQGGYSNATKFQETLALSLATALKETITPYMLRRTKVDVKNHLNLPDKSEQVLFCSMSEEQRDLYKQFLLSDTVRSVLDKESRYGDPMRARILVALTTLRKICNHPDLYIYEVEEDVPDNENQLIDHHSFGHWRRAGKMVVINSLLKIWKKQGHRALIFTQSRAMLCILEQYLEQNGYKYLKMDGSTSIGSRQPIISTFNNDDSYIAFLATTRVGGLGVNLTGADRVVIYDPDWNPATDSQAKERAWRIGQLRNVTVYRLLSAGTIEEKIYQRQVFKQLLSNKVLLDPNQKNYLKTSTLQGLFSLEEPDKSGETETTTIFKHTKVDTSKKNDSLLLSGSVSFSNDKMAAMRKLAQKISKTLAVTNTDNISPNTEIEDDPRERYKKKLLPPPPVIPVETIPVNMINDKETDADFSTVMSELEIVNLCSKPQPINIFKDDVEINDESIILKEDSNPCDDTEKTHENKESKCEDSYVQTKHRKRKHKDSTKAKDLKKEHESINKNKRRKVTEDVVVEDQGDYVLEKLFAKSGVQNALQHDKVIGLAEREDKFRMKTEAQAKAILALKALKKSRIKNWTW